MILNEGPEGPFTMVSLTGSATVGKIWGSRLNVKGRLGQRHQLSTSDRATRAGLVALKA
jgi:hypothetical protein